MMKLRSFYVLLGLLVLVAGVTAAQAQWAPDGVPVVNGGWGQYTPQLVSDGHGGAFILFDSYLSVKMQRLNAQGVRQWGLDGIPVCTDTGANPFMHSLARDDDDGVLVAWRDERAGSQLYVQHLTGDGSALWTADGQWVDSFGHWPSILADGAGGAFVAWETPSLESIVVQRLDAAGAPLWGDGYAPSIAGNAARIVLDGVGGVILGWQDTSLANNYVFGQRLDAAGTAMWSSSWVSPDGSTTVFGSELASDGAGGAYFAWISGGRVLAQRMNADGVRQWYASGVYVSDQYEAATDPHMVADGQGGALIAYTYGGGAVWLNRLDGIGNFDWGVSIPVCDLASTANQARLAPDGYGGAYVVWEDHRDYASTGINIYAQHVDAAGDPQWALDGVPICTADGDQTVPAITLTNFDTAIIAWEDERFGYWTSDIHAQAVHLDGTVGEPAFAVVAVDPPVNALDVPADQDITVTFSTDLNAATATLSNVSVQGSLAGEYVGAVTYNASARTLRINFKFTTFHPGEIVTVVLNDQLQSAAHAMLTPLVWSFTVAADGVAGSFLEAANFAVGGQPMAICAADVNGDDHIDLVVPNFDDATVSVMRGNGRGGFARPTVVATGAGPRGVCAADLDLDGDLDLITADFAASRISALRNSGAGAFPVRDVYVTGNGPISVCAADFDGDRYLDLATANNGANTMSVLRNRGDGTFDPAVTSTTGLRPVSVSSGDLNGDGFVDLITANEQSDNVSVFMNKGNGLFNPKVDLPLGNGPNTIHAVDVDLDGDLDLVAAAGLANRLVFLPNNGVGVFGPPIPFATGAAPYAGRPADVDGDGDLDLVYANANADNVGVMLNNGGGYFGPQTTFAAGDYGCALVAADFDEDGSLDLAAANRDGDDVTVLLNHAGLSGIDEAVPTATSLGRNVPNPFNPSTRIDYTVASAGWVRLAVYDARGRQVVVLVDEHQDVGGRSVWWDGRDGGGSLMASGIYFSRLETRDARETGKMVLLK